MQRSNAFSLIEVVLSLGIIVFSFVTIFGVFPIGLNESGASIYETRSAQLARNVFATLNSRSFNKVNCYGLPLDLGTVEDAGPILNKNNPQFTLYANFPISGQPVITSNSKVTFGYSIGLWFQKIPDSNSLASPTPIAATRVTMLVRSQDRSGPGIEFQSIVGNY